MRTYATALFCCSLLLLPNISSFAQIPAFPGAQGFGAYTIGGRGGEIIHVTTLNADGPGSFKEALQTDGARFIVFDVAGTIDWTSIGGEVILNRPFVTVAGQSSPGDGIMIKNGMLQIATHDVVIRGLRFRVGDSWEGYPPGNRNGIDIAGGGAWNVIIDHCSISWAVDENVGGTGDSHDITIQKCYITEALNCSIHPKGCHSKGLMANNSSNGNISFHHNVLAHNVDRNPQLMAPGEIEVVNNLVYNYGWGARFGNNATLHFIGNQFIPGPDTKDGRLSLIIGDDPGSARAYLNGNIGPGREADEGDQWAITDAPDGHLSQDILFTPTIEAHDVSLLWPTILERVGALPHDPVDQRIKEEIMSGTGSWIDSQEDVGGWPDLRGTVLPTDTDGDGLPDYWELSQGLNFTLANDLHGDLDGDGYSNIEEYLNHFYIEDEFSLTSNDKDDTFARGFVLDQNYPNPFNPSTTIGYGVEQDSEVSVKIYNILGQEIVTLVDDFRDAGYYSVVWDGMDNLGRGVAGGLYLYTMKAGDYKETKKLLLLK